MIREYKLNCCNAKCNIVYTIRYNTIQCHDVNVIQRETKVYQESRELQEIEVLVSLVQRWDSALILTNHRVNRLSTSLFLIMLNGTVTGRARSSWSGRPPWTPRRGRSTRTEGNNRMIALATTKFWAIISHASPPSGGAWVTWFEGLWGTTRGWHSRRKGKINRII